MGEAAAETGWWGRGWVWVVLGVLLMAAGLRGYRIGADDFWLDELLSMETSAGRGWESQVLPTDEVVEASPAMGRITGDSPWWRVWPSMAGQEEMPPLYFMMLRGWRTVFGDGEGAVRALSAVAGVIGVGLAAWAGWLLYGRGGAVRAALLAGVAPMGVAMAQEARPYTWAVVFCLAALVVVIRVRDRGANWWRLVGFGACVYAAMLTHYFAAGPIAGVVIFGALAVCGRGRWGIVGAAVVAGLVYAVTWGPVFLAQRANLAVHAAQDAATGRTIGRFLGQIGYALTFQVVPTVTGVAEGVAAVALAAAVLAAAWLARRDVAMAAGPIWFACWLAMMVAVDAATGSQAMTVARYGVLAGPGLFLAVAGPLSPRGRPWWMREAVTGVVAIASVCSLSVAYARDRGPWRETAGAMARVSRPGDVLAVVATRSPRWWLGRTVLGLSYYMPGGGWRGPVVLLTRPPSADVLGRLRRSPELWVVTDTSEMGPEVLIPGTTATGARRVQGVAMIYRARWASPATLPAVGATR